MIAFLAGLLLVAVIVIEIIYSDNEKFKIENKEMKGKISELKRALKFREYSFISYKGHPLKVVEIDDINCNGTTIKGIPLKLKIRKNNEGGGMLFNEFVKKPNTFFEILIGNKIRTFYVGKFDTAFLTLIEIIDTDKGEQQDE